MAVTGGAPPRPVAGAQGVEARLYDAIDLTRPQLGTHRERQLLGRPSLGPPQRLTRRRDAPQCRLVVEGRGVVDAVLDARRREPGGEALALRHTHREEVVDARGRLALVEEPQVTGEGVAVAGRVGTARRRRPLEPGQLDPQEGGLEPVEPLVDARHEVLALAALTEVAQHPRALGHRRVVRADGTRVPQGAEVLAGVERERGPGPEPTGWMPLEGRSV